MQELALLAVAGVLIIVAVSYFAPKLGVAAPVLLVLVGMACSQLPGAPHVAVAPEWILTVVLPPILYSAAVNVPVVDFRRDFTTIGSLSVLLVAVSAFGTGLLIWWLLPDIGFAAALALGAVISPPDAVAATSIGKRLGLPPRLVTILEGEGLVNDATALVLLRTAIVAISASVTFGGALGDFAYAVAVGVAIGFVVGLVTVWVRSRIQGQPVLTTAISFVVPFLAFIPAEELHASGVLAVVLAGLVTGHLSARKFSAHDRVSERTNWRTIQLLLENGVFLLMGFELTSVVADVEDDGLGRAITMGVLATVALVVLRVTFMIPLIAALRRQQRRADAVGDKIATFLERFTARGPGGNDRRYDRGIRAIQRKQADVAFYASEGLSWRGGAVLAWSGMRGVVTLAAAQTLPTDLPHRPELILVAFTVAILTLVVQGGTLPLVIRRLGIRGNDEEHERREYARLAVELFAASQEVVQNPELRRENGEPFDPGVLDEIRTRTAALSANVDKMLLMEQEAHDRRHQFMELQRMMADAQQNALLDARASGTYSSHTLARAQNFVDSQAVRIL
ncbi:monovalent cation:H+ antiporter, CPA1 family [Lentzea fradiae]|uniref:Monovalent cation:H+ antiporter, CPA1 family n=1 Tax=Lentzea fradiae TaxID=200378 RepID=A0A1G8D4M4_9PSEU|nr:sodium:proton antiporter [Lentzea fradiae]SDH52642.1 monovalent cation:H+ antiporter, CPA1 family [Lentzea fradiae]